MSPAPLSPMSKWGNSHRTTSQDSTSDGIRKRVCKACDRCRLKKSKCDGSSPCSRCKADNAICVFGERKKSHDKVYPKGYVEMLEQQQDQLVSGIQEMYRRLLQSGTWKTSPLAETNGAPLTHDILVALGLLESKDDGSGEIEPFEEDCQKLQSRLIAEGAGYVHRGGSVSSDSDHSQHVPARSASHGTPLESKPTLFKEPFNFQGVTPSPLTRSPISRSRQSDGPPVSWPVTRSPRQPAQYSNDPQLYVPNWAQGLAGVGNSSQIMRPGFVEQGPELNDNLEGMMNTHWDQLQSHYDPHLDQMASYPVQMGTNPFVNGISDLTDMDLDFNNYVQQEGIMT